MSIDSLLIGLNIFLGLNILLLIIGMFKPWVVLWWEDSQYRLKVLKLYGLVILGVLVVKTLIQLFI